MQLSSFLNYIKPVKLSSLDNNKNNLAQFPRGLRLKIHLFKNYSFDHYIIYFYCAETKLIIELDGDIHVHQVEYDAQRTAELEAKGYQVIRFWSGQVLQEMNGVLTMILEICDEKT